MHMLHFIKNDVRSTTGSILQNIGILTNKNSIEDLCQNNLKELRYKMIENKDVWKVNFIHEITEAKFNKLEVENFTREELDDILHFLCTS